MRRLGFILIAAATLPFSTALHAEDRPPPVAVAGAAEELPVLESLTIPGTDYRIDFNGPHTGGVYPSRPLIKAIKQWLSLNFKLRATYPDPIVELAASETILPLRFQGLLSDWPRDIVFPGKPLAIPFEDMMSSHDRMDLIAVYDDEMKTIYLPDSWTGNTPAELSILVHQMVHHLQGATPVRYECPQAREALAYSAQAKWLGLFDQKLENKFEIDPMTLAVSTRCIY